jgi:DNA-directed RNA polymerase specialized sigma24 family protein
MTPSDRTALAEAFLQLRGTPTQVEAGRSMAFDLIWPKYLARFRAAGFDQYVAEDLASDLMQRVIEKGADLREPLAAELWLNQVAFHLIVDQSRRNKRKASIPLDSEGEENVDGYLEVLLNRYPLIDSDEKLCLQRQMLSFADKHPDRSFLLCLAASKGPNSDHLAAIIGRTVNATKVYLHECKKKLEEFVSVCGDYR